MICRVCKAHTVQTGLLHRCSNKNCHAVHWDKSAVVKVKNANKTSTKEASPTWVQKLLSEAGVPTSSNGESYVYIMRLKKNIPDRVPEEFRSKQPNKGNGRFYVGMTGLHPYARYLNHLRGYKSSWFVKRLGTVMIEFEGPMSKKEAEKREPQKADELRSEGFDVHGPTMME